VEVSQGGEGGADTEKKVFQRGEIRERNVAINEKTKAKHRPAKKVQGAKTLARKRTERGKIGKGEKCN